MLQDSEDEEEQHLVTAKAQLLMDCVSDMITHEGLEGMQSMLEAGMKLQPSSRPTKVTGTLPPEMGGGSWLSIPYHLRYTSHSSVIVSCDCG